MTSIRTDCEFWKELRKFSVDVGTPVSTIVERAVRKEMATANGERTVIQDAPETVTGEHVPIWGNLCSRCGYPWKPEIKSPQACPNCHSPFWKKARQRRGKKIPTWCGSIPKKQVKFQIPQSEVEVVPEEKKEEPEKGLDWENFRKVVREL